MTVDIYTGMEDLQNSMIEVTTSPDKTQWVDFVLNHTRGNIFQMPEMAEVYRRTKNYVPINLAAIDTKPFFKRENFSFTKETSTAPGDTHEPENVFSYQILYSIDNKRNKTLYVPVH